MSDRDIIKVPNHVILAQDRAGNRTAIALSWLAFGFGRIVKLVDRGIADRIVMAQAVDVPGIVELARRRGILNELQEQYNGLSGSLARQLRAGTIGINDWQSRMRLALKNLHVQSIIISKGGDRTKLGFADWGRVGGFLKSQYRYLNRYAAAIQEKALTTVASGGQVPFYSEKYLAFRSKLYGGAATATFYQGMFSGLLPQVPRDGQTQCLTNCQCELVFEEGDHPGQVFVYWELRPAEHCEDCIELSIEWAPLVLWLPGAEIAQ